MYLKSIEIYGFKSFANKITFEFQNGITGIVGPNGSGKSNVADAVRWVLGEQSAKQLRGAKMEDVIFSGTESRKPLGSAYVAITLDNSDHSLSIAYDEVTVARRVYRSGESEYLMNGTSCRLKDVTNLFLDTGIGKEGYSIIGQGQIDKILSGKPEERRELFDEAAGIVKYKKNKIATEKALESEQQNLYRVNDILKELESQLKPLEKQAETAKEYLSYRDRQKELDINVFLLEIGQLRKRKEEVLEKIGIHAKEAEVVNKEYDEIKIQYEQLGQELEINHQEMEQIQTSIQETGLKREKMEGEINVLKEQINTAKNDELHLDENTGRVNRELSEKQEEKQKYLSEKQEFDQKIETLQGELKERKKQEEQQKKELVSLQDTAAKEKQNMIQKMNETASLKGKLQRYETMAEQVQIRRSELNQRLLRYRSEETKQEEEYAVCKEQAEKLTEKLMIFDTERELKEKRIQTIQRELDELRKRAVELQREYHVAESRLETVKNLTERYEGYGNSIRHIMEQKGKESGIHGVVADLIKTQKKYETAIEIALGGSIQNIITEDEKTAKQLIEFLKQNRYGRATFLPITSVKGKNSYLKAEIMKEAGVVGTANQLVQADEKYQGIVNQLLGRILVVDQIDHAIAIARKYQYSLRIVTLEGESLNSGGAMTGGAFRNSSNLLGRRRELEELEGQRQKVQMEQKKIAEKLQTLQMEKDCYKEEKGIEEKKRQEVLLELNTVKMKVSSGEKQKQELLQQHERLVRENRELELQVSEIKENQQEITRTIEEQEESRQQSEERIKELEREIKKLSALQASKADQYHQANVDYMALKQKKDFLTMNLQRLTKEEQGLIQQRESYVQKAGESKERIQKLEKEISNITDQMEQWKEKMNSIKEQLRGKEEDRKRITTSHKELFQKREGLASRMNSLDKEEFRLKSQQEKIDEKITVETNYMWEEYEITYGKALPMLKSQPEDLPSLKKELSMVKTGMRTLGDVNVNAIEDFKNVSERFQFLTSQRDDIIKAEENLLQIIEELDIVMRNQFEEKFEQIQNMFNQVFRELFGGGKASLALMEGEDVLEAGIRIVSQPPGKKLQNMMQLSGGEKALTAIALLFAIQSLKPSPFCLLDEIEAALDDSNVDRFAKYLHKLTKDTQFIVITHRRGTMVAADVLYGITMQEKGVSTLVSVNLIENQLEE